MAVPADFNRTEHLQMVIRNAQNKKVKRHFKDLGEEPEEGLGTSRSSLFTACLHQDNDSLLMTIGRNQLYYDIMGLSNEDAVFYIGAVNDLDEVSVVGHPKIGFYFSEDDSTIPEGESRVDMDISFRYMKYNQKTFLPPIATALANEIKKEFVVNRKGILHSKGNLRVMCDDPENGLTKRGGILSNTKEEGVALFQRFYRLINEQFDINKITVNNPEKASNRSGGTHQVYGQTIKKAGYRPEVNVRFRYAYAMIPGRKNKPLFLVTTTYKHPALVYA